jgi:hypothetical protein
MINFGPSPTSDPLGIAHVRLSRSAAEHIRAHRDLPGKRSSGHHDAWLPTTSSASFGRTTRWRELPVVAA